MASVTAMAGIEKLASYQRCIQHIHSSWSAFLQKRQQRLKQQDRHSGAKVSAIPEADIPAVLLRLARGAESVGKMPHQRGDTAAIYQPLADVLEQIG